jgi:hypothetical protein
MSFYIIANNPQNIKFLNKYIFNKEDTIIVFNKSLFENHRSFKNAKKIHFFRENGKSYWGLENIKKCHCKKILLQRGKEKTLQTIFKEKLNYLLKENIEIYSDSSNMENKYYYSVNYKSPMSGSLAFEKLKENNIITKNSTIYLVGFTCKYRIPLPRCHSKILEDNYFKEQKKIYKNLYYINNHII